jgi:hypothetical protein
VPIGLLNVNQKATVTVFGQMILHHFTAFEGDYALF